MKLMRGSRTFAASFALAAVLGFGLSQQSQAFTLIELQYLPAVQLVAAQLSDVKVTNISTNSINVVITAFRDNGNMLVQKTETIAPGTTYTLPIKASSAYALSFHTTIALDTTHAAVADVMTFDKTTGEVISLLPAVQFDTN
jgi:hypothetical protein